MEFRLDHFKLYEIQPYATPGSPYLKGQFDAIERPFALGQLQQFANPVSKNGEGIKNQSHHLTAYDIAATRADPPRQVFLENQFGRQEIRIGAVSFLLVPRIPTREDRLALRVSLPPYVRLQQTRSFVNPERMAASCQIRTSYDARLSVPISNALFDLLMKLDGEQPLEELFQGNGVAEEAEQALLVELDRLWAQRLVRLHGGRDAV